MPYFRKTELNICDSRKLFFVFGPPLCTSFTDDGRVGKTKYVYQMSTFQIQINRNSPLGLPWCSNLLKSCQLWSSFHQVQNTYTFMDQNFDLPTTKKDNFNDETPFRIFQIKNTENLTASKVVRVLSRKKTRLAADC